MRAAVARVVGAVVARPCDVAAARPEAKRGDAAAPNLNADEGGGSLDHSTIVPSRRDLLPRQHSARPLLGWWRCSTRQRE